MPNFNIPSIVDQANDKKSLVEAANQTVSGSSEAQPISSVVTENTEPTPAAKAEPTKKPSKNHPMVYLEDILFAAPRGVEKFSESLYSLGDYVAGDVLPDFPKINSELLSNPNDRGYIFGDAQTGFGKFLEGAAQFATGFIPGFGVAGKAGKLTKLANLGDKSSKIITKGVAASAARGGRTVKLSTLRKLKKAKKAVRIGAKTTLVSAVTDYVGFQGQAQRLSNLLQGADGKSSSDFINWMAYDPNADNNELNERFKNMLEGAAVGAGLAGGAKAFSSGMTKIFGVFKERSKALAKQKELGEEIDEVFATAEALNKFKLESDEISAIYEFNSLARDKGNAQRYEAITGSKIADETPVWKKTVNKVDEQLGSSDELSAAIKTKAGPSYKTKTGATKRIDSDPELDHTTHKVVAAPDGFVVVPKKAPKGVYRAPDTSFSKIDPDTASEKELSDWFVKNLNTSAASLSVGSKRAYIKQILKDAASSNSVEAAEQKIKMAARAKIEEAGLFKGVGPRAAASAVRLATNMPELRALAEVVSEEAREAATLSGGKSSMSDSELLRAGIEASGRNADETLEMFGRMKGRSEEIAKVRKDAKTLHGFYDDSLLNLRERIKDAQAAKKNGTVEVNIKGTPQTLNFDAAMTNFDSALDLFLRVQELWGEFGTNLSLALRQRQDLYKGGVIGRDIAGSNRPIGYQGNLAVGQASETAQKLYRSSTRTAVSDEKRLKMAEMAVTKIHDEGGLASQLKINIEGGLEGGAALSKLGSFLKKGVAVTQEFFINSILSAAQTNVVNVMGNGLVVGLKNFQQLMGAAVLSVGGNQRHAARNLFRANMRAVFTMESWLESVKIAAKSFKSGEATSVKGYRQFSDDRLLKDKGEIYTPKGDPRSADYEGGFYRAVNYLGSVVRLPTRFLMTGDEFFKQINFRVRTRTALATEAYRKGLHRNPKEMAKFIEENFQGLITKEGRFRTEANIIRDAHKHVESLEAGGQKFTGDERQVELDKYMREHYSQNKLKVSEGSTYHQDFATRDKLVEEGKDYSLLQTFTNEPRKGGATEALIKVGTSNPFLTFFIPFIKTPTNIIKYALGNLIPLKGGGPIATSKYIKNYGRKNLLAKRQLDIGETKEAVEEIRTNFEESGLSANEAAIRLQDPEVQALLEEKAAFLNDLETHEAAEYVGRLATAGMFVSSILYVGEKYKDKITGKAPESESEKNAWELSGKKEYSLLIGDKWVSYRRLDPFGMMLGIAADIIHGTGVDREEVKGGPFQALSLATAAIAENVTKQSYMQNIAEFIDVLTQGLDGTSLGSAAGRAAGNIASGFVPNILNVSQDVYKEDRVMLESRRILDKAMARLPEAIRPNEAAQKLPILRDLVSPKLEPKRNVLGEVRTKDYTGTALSAVNPIYASEVSKDIVDMELGSIGNISGDVSPRYANEDGLDMRDFFGGEDGKTTAFDRFQELVGTITIRNKTLRQSLSELIATPNYQRLPEVADESDGRGANHPRAKVVRKVIQMYRGRAKKQVADEYPALKKKYLDILRNR